MYSVGAVDRVHVCQLTLKIETKYKDHVLNSSSGLVTGICRTCFCGLCTFCFVVCFFVFLLPCWRGAKHNPGEDTQCCIAC